MNVSRRKMITLIGGGTILAAGGTYLTTRAPTGAWLPRETAGAYPDLRRRVLSYALLAPNPHNRQPWIAELTGEHTITLYRDGTLNLPETDPFDRQLTIGMGCFIELLVQAAAEENVGTDVDLFPEGETIDRPVARIELGGESAPDPLFSHVLTRHTNRSPYDMEEPVSEGALKQLVAAGASDVRIAATTDSSRVKELRELALAAMILETRTPKTHRESVDLTRIGRAEIEANPDGISLGGPLMETLGLIGILSRETALDPSSSAFKSTLAVFEKSFTATPAFLWLTTRGNSRPDQIAAGRSWLRVQLAATALNLSMQPVSQSLQEYPEMGEHYRDIHAKLAQAGETVQMFGRLGYGPKQAPAPRWPLETRLRNG